MRTALTLALILTATTAQAQPMGPVCDTREGMAKALQEGYGESLVWHGLHKDGPLIELWQSPEGAWTLTMTQPNGVSCAVYGGMAGEFFKPEPGEES